MHEGSLKRSGRISREALFLGVLGTLLLGASVWIPSLRSRRYASPDETAVAIVAERIASFASPRILEPLASAYPWMHPRSWVSQGNALVPVGFLGWPLLLAPFVFVASSRVLPWLGWLLLLSSAYPLFYLLRKRFSFSASWVGVVTMFASPMVILYANRGLFPNVGLLASALWSIWALERVKETGRGAWIAAVFCGLACIIRPVELVWLVPWWIWTGGSVCIRRERRIYVAWALFLTILAVFFLANAFVYGHWWQIGYWLRDNSLGHASTISRVQPSVHLFPFGIHPRNILWNIRSFFVPFLWPSVSVVVAALFVYARAQRGRFWYRELFARHAFIILSAWTILVLLLLYGSGLYQDHVQVGAVTLANSFLRYLLPLAPLTGFATAYLFERCAFSPMRRLIAFIAVGCVVLFGIYTTCFKDDESVLATRKELARYEQVLQKAQQVLPSGSIILSERSDKIFAGVYHAVSPMPSLSETTRLIHDTQVLVKVGLYARPPSQMERDAWHAESVELIDLGTFGREHLYRLSSR